MKLKSIIIWIPVLWLTLVNHANAQFLSAEQAVAMALENNYDIRLTLLNERILENNVTPGNAGFLPVIDALAVQNNSITDSRQEYLSGEENERTNARSSTFNAGVGFDWTLFDGFRMFAGYDVLKKQLEAGQLQSRLEIENTVSRVLRTYYNIVELRQKVKMYETSVELGRARSLIADEKLAIGAGSRLELLQARVDMNSDIAELLSLNDEITEATINLNMILGRNPAEEFTVEDTIVLIPQVEFSELKKQMETTNVNLLLNRTDVELARLNLKSIKGQRYPELELNLGYNFNDQNSQSGFIVLSQTRGFNYGVTARMNLFDGFNQNRQQQNARISIESANLQYDYYMADLNAQLLSTFSIYSNKLRNLELERENVETAVTNFDIANERHRLGELSGLEIREAQQNLMLAHDRLITQIYEARLLEIDLLHLSGSIIPESD